MTQTNLPDSSADPFDLNRFIEAQAGVYDRVISELKAGRKQSHWMWYIFPQLDGLAYSSMSKHYAIKSIAEAQSYLDHPLLGKRLKECAEIVFAIEGRSALEIFGSPDDLKLRSSLTLFASLPNADSVFVATLDKYYQGERDSRTLKLLEMMK